MILYQSDWNRYPEAFPDYNTKNTSFLRQAGVLKSMGVKNHLFLLALHDKSIQGLDPYQEDLTLIQQAKIVRETMVNPWYYFREVAKAPKKSGSDAIPLRANRGNIALFWCFYNHLTVLLIQPRQTGKSFNTDILMTGLLNFHTDHSDILLMTKDNDLRTKNIERLKAIVSNIPKWLRAMGKGDADNKESLTVNATHNTYTTTVGQNSATNAANAGRGFTVPILQVDEIGHIKFISEALQAALPATTEASDRAKQAGAPYGKVFTTTAAKLDTDSGGYVYREFYQKGAAWNEKFYDAKNEAELHLWVRASSTNESLVVVLDFNHRQLGYTDDWLRNRIKESTSNKINTEIDWLNKWSRGSSASPLSAESMREIGASEIKDFHMEIDELGYATRWYIPEHEIALLKDRPLVLSLDTSDAIGNDEMGVVLMCPYTGKILAVAEINKTNLNKFNSWIFKWIMRFERLVLMPERRSSAITMIDYLIEMCIAHEIDPFKRIFNWVVNDKLENQDRYKDIDKPMKRRDHNIYIDYKKYFGFGTSGSGRTSRDILYSQGLIRAAKYIGSTVHDSRLISQIGALTVKHGRIDHTSGNHDDLVVSWLLGYYLISMGNNLEYYGIDSSRILRDKVNNNDEQNKSVEKLIEEQKQAKILKQITDEIDNLKYNKNTDEFVFAAKIRKVKMLYNSLDNNIMRTFNLDSRLQEISKMKKLDRLVNKSRAA